MRGIKGIEGILDLTPLQQGMLFHTLYAPESAVYNLQFGFSLEGRLNEGAFEKAWDVLVNRHSILRTSFVWERVEKPYQLIHRDAKAAISRHDFSDHEASDQDRLAIAKAEEEGTRVFDLTRPTLMRLALIILGESNSRLIWTFHHIILEGWSAAIVIGEFWSLYSDFSSGRMRKLEAVQPYSEYINWLKRQDQRKAEAYWRETLRGFNSPTRLPMDFVAGNAPAGVKTVDACEVTLSKDLSDALRNLVRAHRITPNTLVQGAWSILLSRYSGDEDVVFGAVVSGRPSDLPGVESMVGLFVNTLPARIHVDAERPLIPWLQELQLTQATMRQYEYSSLVQVRAWSDVSGGQPLFHTAVVFQNWLGDIPSGAMSPNLRVEILQSRKTSDQPLSLAVEMKDRLALNLLFDTDRFERQAIERMLEHCSNLIEAMVSQPQTKIGNLPLLREAERMQLVEGWNRTARVYPRDVRVEALFEEQARADPQRVAVQFEGQRLTYGELDGRANRVARHLRTLGVGPEVMVGLCVERSVDMVVGLLGILKAGGAYVPLDPAYPAERLAFMLEDTGAPVVLTQSKLSAGLPDTGARIVCLDRDWPAIAAQSAEAMVGGGNAQSLAYVIYTSGSTGTPKGVRVTHRGITRLVRNTDYIDIRAEDRFAQVSVVSFDAATFEIWGALLNGARMVVVPRDVSLSPREFGEFLQRHGITVLFLTTALFNQMAREAPGALHSLRTMLFGGEAVDANAVRSVLRDGPPEHLLHVYGPTEVTTFATWHRVSEVDEAATTVPIGRPIANTTAYVLDAHHRPVPVGVPGELYLGGDGVASGYHQRAELTAEKFVADPFSQETGARLYRTGDWVRYGEDGAIEFMGRRDDQVKVRGFRIELGEIEAALGRQAGVREAVVVVREDAPGDKRVVAYVVPKDGQAEALGELRNELKRHLPEYMVPSAFVILEALPLTPNGKVDRRALPAPERSSLEQADYVAPRTVTEEILAGIWAEVLGLEKVGMEDNFFELGGHSLLATQVVSRVRAALSVELPLRELFSFPTIAGLGGCIEALRAGPQAAPAPALVALAQAGPAPLSFSQQRLWFLDQFEPGGAAYITAGAFELRGALDVPVLERALGVLMARHEALRTVFVNLEGQPLQAVSEPGPLSLPVVDLSGQAHARLGELLREEGSRGFDLARGPLFRAHLFRLGADRHALLLAMHHIISDGWSLGVLMRELSALYRSFLRDEPTTLPELRVQYRDFARWQRDWLQGEVLEGQLSHWRERLAGATQVLELPADRPRPAVERHRGAFHGFTLPPELVKQLHGLSRREGATLFMTLLSGFTLLLSRYSGQEDLLIGSPIANRNRAEVEPLVGCFVNTLVLRANLEGDPTLREYLGRMREVCLDAFAHQDLPFERLVEELHPVRDMSRNPVFQVMFALQNAALQPLKFEGQELKLIAVDNGTAQFDLTLDVQETPSGLAAVFNYATDLFDASTIARMAVHWHTLLESMVDTPECQLSKLPILTAAERHRQLIEWNDTVVPLPAGRCMHELVAEQAARTPDAVAVVSNGGTLRYGELDRRANQLAHALRKRGVGPDVLVGLCVNRTPDMIIALLGVLKAGGAYVPLDPDYPAERLAFMLEDCGAKVLISEANLRASIPPLPSDCDVIYLDRDAETLAAERHDDPHVQVALSHLAYAIFTSGSTGRPKAALLTHQGLLNLAVSEMRLYGIGPQSRVLQFASLSFDASVSEIAMALCSGAALYVEARHEIAPGPDLERYLEQEKITVISLTPSALAMLDPAAVPSLEQVIAGGEVCSAELVARWASRCRFFNVYGPTEATVDTTYVEYCNGLLPPLIGRPLPNVRIYILDREFEPVPVGVAGELYIGGIGVARGYLNRAELTAQRFLSDPFCERSGATMYRTGDFGRWRADGQIEFIGRIDDQVKLRGFRIELGEIEAAITLHPQVRTCAVIVREDAPGDRRLVAYVVLNGTEPPAESALRDHLRIRLPEYMVPGVFVFIDALPRTSNDKVDRRALPAPVKQSASASTVGPRTLTEETVLEVFRQVLGRQDIGVLDSFFDLGGHSLAGAQLMIKLRAVSGFELPLRNLFEQPTVAGLAEVIDGLAWLAKAKSPLRVAENREEIEL